MYGSRGLLPFSESNVVSVLRWKAGCSRLAVKYIRAVYYAQFSGPGEISFRSSAVGKRNPHRESGE